MAMRSLGYMPNEVELEVIIQRLDMDGTSDPLCCPTHELQVSVQFSLFMKHRVTTEVIPKTFTNIKKKAFRKSYLSKEAGRLC